MSVRWGNRETANQGKLKIECDMRFVRRGTAAYLRFWHKRGGVCLTLIKGASWILEKLLNKTKVFCQYFGNSK